MAGSERDSGSCSSVDEDSRSSLHSPTSSEDSVEVQVTPISLRNKRKLAEPRKIQEPAVITAPLKKRRFNPISEETTVDREETRSLNTPNPFRPWIPTSYKNESKTTATSSTTMSMNTISNTTTTTTTTTILSNEKEEEERRREQDETTQRLHESFRRLQHPNQIGHNRSAVSSRREPRQRLFEPVAATAATTVGYTSPLEGNKGGATREIKGAPNGRRAPRLRHVFLDNLFGNINHREHRETRVLRERDRRREKLTIAIFAILCKRFDTYDHVRTKEKKK